ncbi:exopolysaccharide biosynthesis protein [Polymorphobacter multimanifer]|uniref:polysaccharide pyruvyl transferase family protein n=1 Tax=Polymorphobacter multimanifer TaxID=1070431 RepID=UPI0016676150|nr:polysaccharide pyruvyl transferase family protein [Polymorphobacter multimanifer]GGI67770.1 exopolysaccharide biosynthesis protein [Polymorphobacter multimanifer]
MTAIATAREEPLQTALQRLIDDALVPLINGHAEHICLIDPPGHSNVGDQAILLGELSFLRRHFPQARISFFDVDNYSSLCDRFIERSSMILLHGGGNFGDIWPRHHALRLRILDRFAHKRIVQLPPSISFVDPETLAATSAAIARHPDFHLLVRDHASASLAKANFDCPVILAPDMAFCLDPLARTAPSTDIFCLLRTDKEVATDHRQLLAALAASGNSIESGDWIGEPIERVKRLDRYLSRHCQVRPGAAWLVNAPMLRVREEYARRRLGAGVAMLNRGGVVVTDRLHAHILSCLLGIPNYVFNSIDGKVAAFHSAWTHRFPDAHRMESVAQLRDHFAAQGTRPVTPALEVVK